MKAKVKKAFELGNKYHYKMNCQFGIIEADLKNILVFNDFHVLYQMGDGIVICHEYFNLQAKGVYEKHKELGRKLTLEDLKHLG